MSAFGLEANVLLFALAAAAVWYAGDRLTRSVDAIAERHALGRAFMGFVVLATATQLPEVVTNSTAALRGDAALVLNSMFGGVSLQTAVLVIADFFAARHALTYLSRSASNLAQASMLILLLAIVLGVAIVGDYALTGTVGLAPLVLAAAYLLVIRMLWVLDRQPSWKPLDADQARSDGETAGNNRFVELGTARLVGYSVVAAAVILVAGVVLVLTAEAIAAQSGLGSSFIGVTLLATATSLPEVSTTLAAVRLGRYGMAVADIFGSNMIMIALLLPSDLLYREGVLLAEDNASARFALVLGIALTAIYLAGLVLRQRRSYLRLGIDSWAVLVVYAAGIAFLYTLR